MLRAYMCSLASVLRYDGQALGDEQELCLEAQVFEPSDLR
jgi:hypothetical protein